MALENFCTNPFYKHTLRNDIDTLCCWLPAGADNNDIINSLLQNQRPRDCFSCWQAEDAGFRSKRQLDNQILVQNSGLTLEQLHQQAQNPEHRTYQIKLSNHCNLSCKTCYPQDSTGWYREYNHWHRRQAKDTYRINADIINSIDYDRARVIEFLGGEPLLHPDHVTILQNLIAAGNTNCELFYTTNGTKIPSDQELELLRQFARVNFSFSIDGIDNRFEYMRYPASWQTVLENITALKHEQFQVSCVHTLSNLNIMYLDEFLTWAFRFFGIGKVAIGWVRDYPAHWQPHVLPVAVKDLVRTRWQQHKLWPILQRYLPLVEHTASDWLLNRAWIHIQRQDRYRNQRIKDFLPELVSFDDIVPLRKSRCKVKVPVIIPIRNESLPL